MSSTAMGTTPSFRVFNQAAPPKLAEAENWRQRGRSRRDGAHVFNRAQDCLSTRHSFAHGPNRGDFGVVQPLPGQREVAIQSWRSCPPEPLTNAPNGVQIALTVDLPTAGQGKETNVCTVKSARAVLVCDQAIGRVRQELGGAFERGVAFTHVDFQPTLVEAAPEIDAERFIAVVQAASAAAQLAPPPADPGHG
jgi:hypothetical protein